MLQFIMSTQASGIASYVSGVWYRPSTEDYRLLKGEYKVSRPGHRNHQGKYTFNFVRVFSRGFGRVGKYVAQW